MSELNPLTLGQIPSFNQYAEPTVELVLRLLGEAYEDEAKLDRVLKDISEEVFTELENELYRLAEDGKIDLDEKINLYNNPSLLVALKRIENVSLQRFNEYSWICAQVMGESLSRSYSTALMETYNIFNYPPAGMGFNNLIVGGTKSYNQFIKITDTYVREQILNVPWCQDGKVYSDRIWGNVSQFQRKLSYVLEQGITKGKGMDWMKQAWRKLAGGTAYNTARLLKTETMAMWSLATKSAYLDMGIEYVQIIGDAECGGICLSYVSGQPIPLAEARLGDLLPPYHPNCACSYVAYEVPAYLADKY